MKLFLLFVVFSWSLCSSPAGHSARNYDNTVCLMGVHTAMSVFQETRGMPDGARQCGV